MFIYIVKSGNNSKIGITKDFVDRGQAYNTHNPSWSLAFSHECDEPTARKIETEVRRKYQAVRVGDGREWFEVEADVLSKFVRQRLGLPDKGTWAPGSHGVEVPGNIWTSLERIGALAKTPELKKSAREMTDLRDSVIQRFEEAFQLGVCYRKPPDLFAEKYGPQVCFQYAKGPFTSKDRDWNSVPFDDNEILKPPYAHHAHVHDHEVRFYDFLETDSGCPVAFCRATVFMPYLQSVADPRVMRDCASYAEKYGWMLTRHDEWSWWWPGETALLLYQSQQSLSDFRREWERSFRRWVFENRKRLELATSPSVTERIKFAVSDLANDCWLPLDTLTISQFTTYLKMAAPHIFETQEAYETRRLLRTKRGTPLGYRYREMHDNLLYIFNEWLRSKGLPLAEGFSPEAYDSDE